MIRSAAQPRREGIILVVVVSLLALFAAIGLGYVVYSESAATASRLSREAQVVVTNRAELDPELILNQALGALIYDKPDDASGAYCALRGHSLSRSMYGWVMDFHDTTSGRLLLQSSFVPPAFVSQIQQGLIRVSNPNSLPFNGAGRLKAPEPVNVAGLARPLSGLPWDRILNYTFFNHGLDRDPVVRDPERYPVNPTQSAAYRLDPGAVIPRVNPGSPPDQRDNVYYGGYNVPYTYPDLNNAFLGAVRASDGKVLIPSFHRPYLFMTPGPLPNPPVPDLTFLANPNHPDWYRPSGRLKLMRPRPVDQLTEAQVRAAIGTYPVPENIGKPQIDSLLLAIQREANLGRMLPYPSDLGGDVKNLLGSAGGNDSVWMDLGLPVRTTRDGRKYKPLVAFLITDLDNRVNLNVHGNTLGPNNESMSNQGLGRHEVNPRQVLVIPGEYPNLFRGTAGIAGKYTASVTPSYGGGSMMNSYLSPPLQVSTGGSSSSAFFQPEHFKLDLDARRVDFANNQVVIRLSQPPQAPAAIDGTVPLAWSTSPDYVTIDINLGPPVPGSALQPYDQRYHTGFDNEGLILPGIAAFNGVTERFNHSLLYNPLRATGNSRTLDAMEMHRLIGRYDSVLNIDESMLVKLLPQNLGSGRSRQMVTLLSADVERAGLVAQANRPTTLPPPPGTPPLRYFSTDPTQPNIAFPMAQAGEIFVDPANLSAQAGNSPSVFDYVGNPVRYFYGPHYPPLPPPTNTAALPGQVQPFPNAMPAFDGRSAVTADLDRIDLNRPLRPYPAIQSQLTGANTGQYYALTATVTADVQAANQDRQQFAKDIFDRLCAGVGVPVPGPSFTVVTTGDTREFDTYKWLAQLAANVVDYIDEDDVMTRFYWHTNPAGIVPPTDIERFVTWGTERPKIALNEVYVEQTNGETTRDNDYIETQQYPWPPSGGASQQYDKKRAIKYMVNVWAELHHTMVPPYVNEPGNPYYAQFVDRQRAWLVNTPPGGQPKFSPYKLHLVKSDQTPSYEKEIITRGTAGRPNPMNPALSSSGMPPPDAPSTSVEFINFTGPNEQYIDPMDTENSAPNSPKSFKSRDGVKNKGFFVVGPKKADGVSEYGATFTDTNKAPSVKADEMSFDVFVERPGGSPVATKLKDLLPTVVLQRLADPYRPASPPGTPVTDPTYNTYVGVEVTRLYDPVTATFAGGLTAVNVEGNKFDHDYRKASSGQPGPAGLQPPKSAPTQRKSVVRRQPFAGAASYAMLSKQGSASSGGSGNDPGESFFRHNTDQTTPPPVLPEPGPSGILERFEWLVHPDRKLASPVELLHVSGVAPWELTKRFIDPPPGWTMAMPTKPTRHGHTAPWLDERDEKTPAPTTPGQPTAVKLRIDNAPATPPPPPQTASTRLYRALEFFRVGDRTVEMAFGGRTLGKVNINTIWDKDVFDAVCDAVGLNIQVTSPAPQTVWLMNASMGFTQKDVNAAWYALVDRQYNLTARTPRYYDTGTYSQITASDLPFWGMGAPHVDATGTQYPQVNVEWDATRPPQLFQNAGVDATLFRRLLTPGNLPPQPTALTADALGAAQRKRIFEAESQFNTLPPPTGTTPPIPQNPTQAVYHPIREQALLSKIFEHLTVRSNVFAVYMTVGYFEVTDDSVKPELLGGEIGVLRDANGAVVENKAVRHRMFAIVDRTQLTLNPPRFNFLSGSPTFWSFVEDDVFKQGPAAFNYSSRVMPIPGEVPNPWNVYDPARFRPDPNPGAGPTTAWRVSLPIRSFEQFGGVDGRGFQTARSATVDYAGVTCRLVPVLIGTSLNPSGEPATVLYVGTGAEQRRLVVKQIQVNALNPGVAEVELGMPPITFNPTTWQPLGPPPALPVLVTNALPGNPGPQPDFDHRLTNYRGVVLYSVILE